MKLMLLTLLAIISSNTLVGCSTQNFSKKIETNDVDLLNEESLMRYNGARIDVLIGSSGDFIAKAQFACHQNKFTKGFTILETEMHKNKTNPFYWNALGTCYSLYKELPKAMFYYDLGMEAVALLKDKNKIFAEAILANNIGLIHLNFKRYTQAFESFKKASTLLPDFFTPQFNIAQLYIEFNDNDKALEILKKLELKNPNDIDLLYSLSLIYFRKNDLERSYAAINRIKPNYLNRPDIVGLYAYNLMKKNRLSEAHDIIEKRLYANEFDQRNKLLLEEINQKIKDQVRPDK